MGGALLVHNQLTPISGSIFLHHIFKNNAKLSVSSASWPHDKSDKNGLNSFWTSQKVA